MFGVAALEREKAERDKLLEADLGRFRFSLSLMLQQISLLQLSCGNSQLNLKV